MLGAVSQFTIADLVLDELRAQASALVPADGDLPYFYLGAASLSLSEFLPSRPDLELGEPNSPLLSAWMPILQLLAGTPNTPGLFETLRTLRDVLRRFREQAARGADGDPIQKDLAKLALIEMRAELESLPGLIVSLQTQLSSVSGLQGTMGRNLSAVRPLDKRERPLDWRARDRLHGSRTGQFLSALRQRAETSGDPRLKAFALGATVSYGAALSGNPFLNGVVGGPHRNQWWRQRYIANFVDSWVFGYYSTRRRLREQAQEVVLGANGTPTPAYATWGNACGAELQRRIELGGIRPDEVLHAIRDKTAFLNCLPNEFVQFWVDAHTDVYGPSDDLDPAGLQGGYALMWLTLWISTSAELLSCTPPDQVNPPDSCGGRPDWVQSDGSVAVNGTVVPPPQVGTPRKPSVAEEICGVVAVILGAMLTVTGVFTAAGIGLMIVGVAAFADGLTDPDWLKLRCHADWVGMFLTNLDNSFRQLLVISGLGVPYTVDLAHNPIALAFDGQIVPYWAAMNTCRSPNELESQYPRSFPNMLDWTRYPVTPSEPLSEVSYPLPARWPYHFVDGQEASDNGRNAVPRFVSAQINPVSIGADGVPRVLDRSAWERARQLVVEPQGFGRLWGNAVEVSLALVAAEPRTLLDWDLDGDRSIGFATWSGTPSAPVPE